MKIPLWIGAVLVAVGANAAPAETSLVSKADIALHRSVEFFRTEVAVNGTYLWQYSEDLSKREGEGKATPTQGWIQPPGTPAVGLALLSAWRATSNAYYLEAARETADGLLRGQLRSGGWQYSVDFSPEGRSKFAYRDGGKQGARNTTTFDDNTTQSAIRFLMQLDEQLGFRDSRIQEAIEFALTSVLKAQYPNGAWPQGYDQFPSAEKFPVKSPSFPETWPRVWPGSGQYWLRYTLNDGALVSVLEMLFEASQIYGRAEKANRLASLGKQCHAAAGKAGDFLLLAQMPDPQPAWAQQYDFDMHPAWARKFEPPAISGGESQGVLRALLRLYRETGNQKYLAPVPRALEYLRQSRLSDGRLARFYELRSNKPLYFTRSYELTYDDSDAPTHYAFKVQDNTDSIAREYQLVKNLPASELKARRDSSKPRRELAAEVEAIVRAQDSRGRWVEEGRLRYHGPQDPTTRVIRCATFIRHIETLSEFLAEARSGL